MLHTVSMGNPHAIQWVPDPETAPVGTVGPEVETAPVFPHGTNAEFARVLGSDVIELRVWERGVGETLACGTGAAATAYLAHRQGRVGRGGDDPAARRRVAGGYRRGRDLDRGTGGSGIPPARSRCRANVDYWTRRSKRNNYAEDLDTFAKDHRGIGRVLRS